VAQPRLHNPSPLSRRLPLAAALAAAALTLTACGSGDDSGSGDTGGQGKQQETSGSADVKPKAGGALNVIAVSETRGLDPWTAISNSYTDNTRLNSIYDSLLWSDPKTGKTVPQIAESLAPAADGLSWTLKIKPNVKFSDGTPYDAAAVKFTWDRHADPASKSMQAGSIRAVKASTVVDAQTLKIELTSPNANFDHVVASNLSFIVSPTAYQKDPAAFMKSPVGAGPFTLKEWIPNDHQTYVKNPSYWQGPEKPYLDTVTFKVVADGDQAVQSVLNGTADLKISGAAVDSVKAKSKGLQIDKVTLIGGESIMFNASRPPFDDIRARKAVALALDTKDMNQIAFQGQGNPAESFFPPDSPVVEPGTKTVPAQNLAEAQRLLDELAKEGKPLTFTFAFPQNPQSKNTSEYVQSRLQTLKNIKVELAGEQIAPFQGRVTQTKDFSAALWSWYLADPEPGLFQYVHSSSPSNYLQLKDPALDELLLKGRNATDPAARKAAYTELAKIIQEKVPLWTYQQSVITAFHKDNTAGLTMTGDGMMLMDRVGLRG
jgi:peptide/nickel transport system substrate-binding protein